MKLYTFTLVFAGVATMAKAGFWKNDFSCTAGDDFDGMNSNLASLPALSTPHPTDPSKCYLRLGDDTLGTSAASAFIPYTLNTARTFSTTFEYRMFGDSTPADGITFTMHQDSREVNALGSTGGYLGVYDTNAIQNALVIELDTCKLRPCSAKEICRALYISLLTTMLLENLLSRRKWSRDSTTG